MVTWGLGIFITRGWGDCMAGAGLILLDLKFWLFKGRVVFLTCSFTASLLACSLFASTWAIWILISSALFFSSASASISAIRISSALFFSFVCNFGASLQAALSSLSSVYCLVTYCAISFPCKPISSASCLKTWADLKTGSIFVDSPDICWKLLPTVIS